MNVLLLCFERASLFGLAALVVALGAQLILDGRVPSSWRVWLWRVACLQTALALLPLAPLRLAVLPPRAQLEAQLPPQTRPLPAMPSSSIVSPGHTLNATGAATYRVQASPPVEAALSLEVLFWLIPIFYGLGVGFQLIALSRSLRRVRRHLRACTSVKEGEVALPLKEVARRMGVASLPRLLKSSGDAPFLTGIVRPVIVLPAALLSASSRDVEAILAHELAHLKRRDLVWGALLWFVQTLLWFHPLIWTARHFLPLETESACDEMVLRSTRIAPKSYGELLLNTMHFEQTPLTVGVTDGYFAIKTRLLRLNRTPKRPHRLLQWTFAGVLGLTFGALIPFRFEARAQAPLPEGKAASSGSAKPSPVQTLLTKIQIVTGRVLSPNDQPVVGARVSWVAYGADENHKGEVLSTVQSDAQGRFRFNDSTSLIAQTQTFSGPNLDLTPPQLFIEDPNWGLSRVPIASLSSGPLEIRLAPASELQTSYLDDKGQPIPDLRVRLRYLDLKQSAPGAESGSFLTPSEMKRFAARTDDKGVVRFAGLPQGATVYLEAEDERFAQPDREESNLELSRTAKTLAPPIHLVAGITIQGHLSYGSSGKSVGGVRVGAQSRGAGWGSAVSDENGDYKITGMVAGSYNVALDLQDNQIGEEWTARAHENVVVAAGDHLQKVDFALVHGVLISGKVTAQNSAQPVAGLQIGIYGPAHPRSSGWVQSATTASDGTYRLRVPQGKQIIYLMSAPPAGFGPMQGPPTSSVPLERSKAFGNETYEVTVKDGQSAAINWQLPKTELPRAIQVQVLDETGKPAVGAQVLVTSTLSRMPFDQTRQTDAEGRLTLEDNPTTLRARRGDSATIQATPAKAGESVVLHLEADTMTALTGVVTDANGQPVPGAKISLTRRSNGMGIGSQGVAVDDKGRHTFSDLWPDIKYSLSATAPGYSEEWSREVQLDPGEARTLSPLILVKAQSFVAGRVVNEKGEAMAGMTVSISGSKTAVRQTTTDRKGLFRFDSVVAGATPTLATGVDNRFANKKVTAGASNVELVIPDSAR